MRIRPGLAQRIRALNQFIDDVYHGREIVHDDFIDPLEFRSDSMLGVPG